MNFLALTSDMRSKRATSVGWALAKSPTVAIPPPAKRVREVGPMPKIRSTGCNRGLVVMPVILAILGEGVVGRMAGLVVVKIRGVTVNLHYNRAGPTIPTSGSFSGSSKLVIQPIGV